MFKKFILTILLSISASVYAQPITLIVPFTAGGAFDKVAREYGKYLEDEMKVPVSVTNIAGAGGWLGMVKLDQSNSRTLVLTSSSVYIHLHEKELSVDNYKFISVIADSPLYLVVNKNIKPSCESLRSSNTPLFFGTSGRDSVTSMPIYFISKKYKNAVDVPLKGNHKQ